jgi:hypothetical protein
VRGASDDAFKPVVEAEAVAVETKTKRAWVQISPHRRRKEKEREGVGSNPSVEDHRNERRRPMKAAFEGRGCPK